MTWRSAAWAGEKVSRLSMICLRCDSIDLVVTKQA